MPLEICAICSSEFELRAGQDASFSLFVDGLEGIISCVCKHCRKDLIATLRNNLVRPKFLAANEENKNEIPLVMRAYKVVKMEYDRTYSSYCALGFLSIRYLVGQEVYVTKQAEAYGLGLTAFKRPEQAVDFLVRREGKSCGNKYHIFECQVVPMRNPSKKSASAIGTDDITRLMEKGQFDRFLLDSPWIYGTILCDSIKLLHSIPEWSNKEIRA